MRFIMPIGYLYNEPPIFNIYNIFLGRYYIINIAYYAFFSFLLIKTTTFKTQS